ncbi:hypothetical protein MMC17_001724 [Xylographa soralifera]|nr:hypothetical protein [Xylographa soralifera]
MTIIEADPSTPHHLQEVADILDGAKKIVVITGAGISTNSGIPDFRSNDGLYSLIETKHKKTHGSSVLATTSKVKGRDLFDSAIWRNEQSTSTFYTFIASLRRKIKKEVEGATVTHRFIRQLRDQRKLVRCYTQNIDGLESREGLITDLSWGKGARTRFTKKAVNLPHSAVNSLPGNKLDGGCEVIQLHGDLESLRCTICSESSAWDEQHTEAFLSKGVAPNCPKCTEKNKIREEKGMRSTTIGRLRPNIVLYGEQHPLADELGAITENDLRLGPEVVLILGTSLKVKGLQVIVKEFARSVHAKAGKKRKVIFVNHTKPPGGIWKEFIDYHVAMDCDQWVQDALVRRADLGQTQSDLAKKLLQAPKPSSKLSTLEKLSFASAEDKQGIIAAPSTEHKPLGSLDPILSVESQHRLGGAFGTDNIENLTSIMRTPSKPRQLPTPPSSCEHRNLTSAALIYSTTNSDNDMTAASPAKRRKIDIKIWEDEGSDATHLMTPQDDSRGKLLPKNAAAMNKLQFWRTGSIVSTLAGLGKQDTKGKTKDTPAQAVDNANVENDESHGFRRSESPSKEALPSAEALCRAFVEVPKLSTPSVAQSCASIAGRKRRRE